MEERLQKILSERGVCSRRKAEELILANRVKVNGKIVNTLGVKVDVNADIEVDNKLIFKMEKKYYLLNKPANYLTTMSDPLKRRTITDLFSDQLINERVYPVGRLDYETSGAIILTNDGELANKLTKGVNNIPKVYQIRVYNLLNQEMVTKLLRGIVIDGITCKIDKISNIKLEKKINQSELTIEISEGKNRQIRSMLTSLGLEVKWVKRLSFANIDIEGLKEGEIRALKPHEIKKLFLL